MEESKSRRWAIVFLVAVILLIVGIQILAFVFKPRASAPKVEINPAQKRPVILIGIDTLRADHLGCYGYPKKISSYMDTLAQQGTLFENCIAPIPRTTQSVASIMTGRYPQSHGVRNLLQKLPETEITLAEYLKYAGYKTMSVQATGTIRGMVDKGIDLVLSTPDEWNCKDTTNRALLLMESVKNNEPFFLWIFYRDPHMPYHPPRNYFDPKYQGRYRKQLTYHPTKAALVYHNNMTGPEQKHAISLYDSEIKYLDEQLGQLLAYIDERFPDAIVIVTADHGESLGENNYYFDHGDILNQPGLHVPLIIKGIDFKEKRVKKIVRLIDIAPTVLAALGIKDPGNAFDGVDLEAYVADEDSNLFSFEETGNALLKDAYDRGFRYVPGIQGRVRAAAHKNWRAVYMPTFKGPKYFLYDTEKDPAHTNNLFPKPEATYLFEALGKWILSAGEQTPMPTPTTEEKEKLKSLGYL